MSAASMATGTIGASLRSRSIPMRATARQAGDPPPAATVLYDDRAVTLRTIGRNPKQAKDALWVRKRDLPAINEFELKPQGACRADLCIPIAKSMLRGEYFDLTAFAQKIGQAVVADLDAQVWSFGEVQSLRGRFLEGRIAPEIVVPDRAGRPVHLTSLRGKKVLVVTWASW
jgi:hypothetical protein